MYVYRNSYSIWELKNVARWWKAVRKKFQNANYMLRKFINEDFHLDLISLSLEACQQQLGTQLYFRIYLHKNFIDAHAKKYCVVDKSHAELCDSIIFFEKKNVIKILTLWWTLARCVCYWLSLILMDTTLYKEFALLNIEWFVI